MKELDVKPFNSPDDLDLTEGAAGFERRNPELPDEASFTKKLGAHFTEMTTGGAAIQSFNRESVVGGNEQTMREAMGFNPVEHVPERHMSDARSYLDLSSPSEIENMNRQLDEEKAVSEIIANTGGAESFFMTMGVQFADPVMLGAMTIPALNAPAAGYGVAKGALAFAKAGFFSTLAQEAVLLPLQERRTLVDSAVNVVADTIISSAIGGAVGKFMSKAEFKEASDIVKRTVLDDVAREVEKRADNADNSASAARVQEPTFEETELLGSFGVNDVLNLKGMIPKIAMQKSPSKNVRTIFAELGETEQLTVGNKEGKASAAAVETKLKEYDALRGKAVQTMDELYVKYRTGIDENGGSFSRMKLHIKDLKGRDDGVLSRTEFNEELGAALNRNGESRIPEVSEAAKRIRADVLDIVTDKAVAANLLEKDFKVAGADSHFTWVHNTKLINENPLEFKKMVGGEVKARVALQNEQIREQALFDLEQQARQAADSRAQQAADKAVDPIVTQKEVDLEGLPKVKGFEHQGQSAPIRKVASKYMADNNLEYSPIEQYAEVDKEFGKKVAQAFEDMEHAPNDPKVAEAYDAMTIEVKAQYQAMLDSGIKIEFITPDMKDPYPNPRMMTDDVNNNNHIWVYPTEAGFGAGVQFKGNPLLEDSGFKFGDKKATVNDVFRAVHDYFGHAKEGLGFRENGEENAYRSHASMFSTKAQRALATETRGQNSWLNFGKHGEANKTAKVEDTVFADQKTGLLPDEIIFAGTKGIDGKKGFANKSEAEKTLNDTDYIIMTPENPDAKQLGEVENAQLVADFKKEMEAQGHEIIEVEGNYDGAAEISFLVKGLSREEGALLGSRWQQKNILHKTGLAYMDGRLNPSKGKVKITPDAKKDFSVIELADGSKVKFQLEIDFDTVTTQPWAKKLDEIQELNDAELADIADGVLMNINGGEMGKIPKDIVPHSGVLKERTLGFIGFDKMRPWLNTNAEDVLSYYFRTLPPEIEMKQQFGSIDMSEQLAKIRDEYSRLADGAETPAQAKAYADNARDDITRIENLRDMVLNQYGIPENPNGFFVTSGRVLRKANFVTKLGGMTVSAIPDIARPVMRHGLANWGKGIGHMLSNMSRYREFKQQAKAMNVGFEVLLNTRFQKMADVGADPSEMGLVERGLSHVANTFGLPSLMSPWNDFHKQISTLIVTDRILRVARSGKMTDIDRTMLANLGLDKDMLKRIGREHRKIEDGKEDLLLPEINRWEDKAAAQAFKFAVMKDVDTTIVTPNHADVPTLMHGEVGKTVFQFSSFGFSAVSKILSSGLQQRDAAFLNGVVMSVALGSVVYATKQWTAGREISTDPKVLLAEAIDRSGVLGIFANANNNLEKITGGKVGMSAFTGQQMSRYHSRNIPSAILGATAGTLQDAANVVYSAAQLEADKSALHSLRRLMPYQNIFYIRRLLDHFEEGLADNLQ